MAAKNSRTSRKPAPTRTASARPARANRRAAQRAEARARARPTPRISPIQIAGAVVAVLAVIAIIVWSATRAGTVTHKTTNPPLVTDPSAINSVPSTQIGVGRIAPNFTLHDVNGRAYTLRKQQGHPVLLEFFAVWCPHCQAESSVIRQIQAAYAPKGVRIWAILASPYGPNYDKSNGTDLTLATKDDLAWFRRTFHEDVPMLVDPKFSVMKQYGNNGYPGIFVIDRNGVIVSSTSGEESYSVLAKALDKGLKASAP